MSRGRKPRRPEEWVETLSGSEESAAKMRAILAYQEGRMDADEASRTLCVERTRFFEMLREAYQGMRDSLEPKKAGRPRKEQSAEERRIAELESEVEELKSERLRDRIRMELAQTMPHVLVRQPVDIGPSKKAPGGGISPPAEPPRPPELPAPRLHRCRRAIKPRHSLAQTGPREAERRVRLLALWHLRSRRRQGKTLPEVAAELWLSESTLRAWRADLRRRRLQALPRGRPHLKIPRDKRQEVIRYIHKNRYRSLTLASLRRRFPGVSREILSSFLERWKYAWARRRAGAEELSWTVPGEVWTADYTESDFPIDGIYRYVLVVKDLGSGFVLAAVPARSESTKVFVETLARLFFWLGAPLVLKTDNGSAFRARMSRRLLARSGVLQLLSPPYYPRYNGAIEASIGALKERIMDAAFEEGDAFRWTASALREAVRIGNDSPKWNAKDATPSVLFQSRAGVSRTRRAAFIHSFRCLRAEERLRRSLLPEARPNNSVRAAIVRSAIRRALEACGILVVSRRRISPGVSS